jgi:O-antigen ligase
MIIVLAPDVLLITAVVAMVAFRIRRGRVVGQAPKLASDDLMAVGLAFALGGLWSAVSGGGGAEAVIAVLRFSLVPIGFAVVRGSARVDLRPTIWLGAVAGSIAAGTVSLLALFLAEMVRPTSAVNPIHFGEMALLLGFIATVTRGLAVGDEWHIARWTLAAVTMSLTAAVLSQSRGGWIAVPAIVIVALVHQHRSPSPRRIRYLGALLLAITPVMVIAVNVNDQAARRAFERGVSQTVDYVANHGQTEVTGETSIGARFEMWRSAFAGFRQSPVLGVGWGNMDDRFAEDVAAGVRADRIAEHHHPHNQYLSHLGSGGIVGLTTLLALLAAPGWIFRQALRSRRSDTRALGAAGLLVVIGYALFALTDSVFETASPLVFYVVAVGTIAAQIDRLGSEQVFVYPSGDGMEQSERPVEGPRTHTFR